LAQTDPDNPYEAELIEMRRWYAVTKAKEELASLRLMKARYEAGDRTLFQSLDPSTRTAFPQARGASSSLPKPEPPHTYTKKNRREFNQWERDCESFFLRSPANFITEEHKVEFGSRYISENLKSLWRAHCESRQRSSPQWQPQWSNLKTVMLDALGTPSERKQQAQEALKRCRQRSGQTPTDLLDYMRPLWEELGSAHSPELQVLEYISALHDNIRQDLFLLSEDRRNTIPSVEEQANVIYRRRGRQDLQSGNERSKKPQPTSHADEGDAKPPKKQRRSEQGQKGPSSANPKSKGFPPPGPGYICRKCGVAGHWHQNCPKPTAQSSESVEVVPGKAKGSKD
jgi:hypothetical protein